MSDATLTALEKSLDLRMRAHELHTSNIANANVPGFKAKKIDFENRMREALQALDTEGATQETKEFNASQAAAQVTADIYEDPLATMNGTGNTVNMETEQTEIAKNTIAYQTATQLVSKKMAMARYVLGEGGR